MTTAKRKHFSNDQLRTHDTHHGNIGRECTVLSAEAKDMRPPKTDALPQDDFYA